jgi:hypothetical protein
LDHLLSKDDSPGLTPGTVTCPHPSLWRCYRAKRNPAGPSQAGGVFFFPAPGRSRLAVFTGLGRLPPAPGDPPAKDLGRQPQRVGHDVHLGMAGSGDDSDVILREPPNLCRIDSTISRRSVSWSSPGRPFSARLTSATGCTCRSSTRAAGRPGRRRRRSRR